MAADFTATQEARSEIIPLGTRNGIEMAIARRNGKTLGKVISKVNSPDLIDGVQIEPLEVYPDDRGFFTELARLGKGLAAKMVPDDLRKIQVSLTLTYPGTVKAIHYHAEQTIFGRQSPAWCRYFSMIFAASPQPLPPSTQFLRVDSSPGKSSFLLASAMATKRSALSLYSLSTSPIGITTLPMSFAFLTITPTSPTTGKLSTSNLCASSS